MREWGVRQSEGFNFPYITRLQSEKVQAHEGESEVMQPKIKNEFKLSARE